MLLKSCNLMSHKALEKGTYFLKNNSRKITDEEKESGIRSNLKETKNAFRDMMKKSADGSLSNAKRKCR